MEHPVSLRLKWVPPEGLKGSPHWEGQNHAPLDGGEWLRCLISGICRKPALQAPWETVGLQDMLNLGAPGSLHCRSLLQETPGLYGFPEQEEAKPFQAQSTKQSAPSRGQDGEHEVAAEITLSRSPILETLEMLAGVNALSLRWPVAQSSTGHQEVLGAGCPCRVVTRPELGLGSFKMMVCSRTQSLS